MIDPPLLVFAKSGGSKHLCGWQTYFARPLSSMMFEVKTA